MVLFDGSWRDSLPEDLSELPNSSLRFKLIQRFSEIEKRVGGRVYEVVRDTPDL